MSECIKLIFVFNQNDHYCCMHRLADKHAQGPTLFRERLCNSEANRYEIYTILRWRVKITVSGISPESVKFHYMTLTMIFKLNFEKNLDLGA